MEQLHPAFRLIENRIAKKVAFLVEEDGSYCTDCEELLLLELEELSTPFQNCVFYDMAFYLVWLGVIAKYLERTDSSSLYMRVLERVSTDTIGAEHTLRYAPFIDRKERRIRQEVIAMTRIRLG